MMVLKHPKAFSGILALPEEIIHGILTELDYVSLSSCRLVCRYMNGLFEHSAQLRYNFELGLDGLVNGPCCNMSSRDRLDLLLRSRKAWRKPGWRKACDAQIVGEFRVSEIVDNVFAGLSHDCLRFDAYSLALSGSSRCWGELHWSFDGNTSAHGFAMDPSQDLVIFMTNLPCCQCAQHNVALEIRSLSTASQHPEAIRRQHPFFIPFTPDGVSKVCEDVVMQITGNLLAIILTMQEDCWRTMLWDWTDGSLLLDRTTTWHEEILVLSPTAYIITSVAGQGSIDIYSLRVTDDSSRLASVHVGSLSLPPINSDAQLVWFSGHLSVYPAPSQSPQPFLPANDSAIISMVLEYENEPAGADFVTELHVPSKVFLSYIQDYECSEAMPVLEPWNEWGPLDTRMFVTPAEPIFESHNYGQRVIHSPEPVPSQPGMTLVEVLDFNPHAARSFPCDAFGYPTKTRLQVHHEPSVIRNPDIFSECVVTLLPYTSMGSYVEGSFSGFVLDDERLIGIRGIVTAEVINQLTIFML
ncbi:hypothetical protein HGRIS_003861 [Hohenbuehelia grisea]|uniref:F-box domain-containing protein n=1 Tax=Hohenbuehelia grisea TaxID=104357 RepID=A0ABR3JHM5_9AGAR